jgi:hypothetical protein
MDRTSYASDYEQFYLTIQSTLLDRERERSHTQPALIEKNLQGSIYRLKEKLRSVSTPPTSDDCTLDEVIIFLIEHASQNFI